MQAKSGELTLANNFLEQVLTKAGLQSAKWGPHGQVFVRGVKGGIQQAFRECGGRGLPERGGAARAVVKAVNGNIKALLSRGRGCRNLDYLLLKAQRLAATKTEFVAFLKAV
jgi:hypothetical protein